MRISPSLGRIRVVLEHVEVVLDLVKNDVLQRLCDLILVCPLDNLLFLSLLVFISTPNLCSCVFALFVKCFLLVV